LSVYLDKTGILSEGQYGFRKNRSSIDCIESHLNEIVSVLDKRMKVLNISCDLSKAFERVDHEILMFKLEYYGLCGPPLEWFRSYLHNRKQFVELTDCNNTARSDCLTVRSGVPQGSILGPLLFLLYINDFETVVPGAHISLYADDANIAIGCSEGDLQALSQRCLENVADWIERNNLVVNCDKSKAIAFCTKNCTPSMPDLFLLNEQIDYCEHFNFLGVHIDKGLNWSEHCCNLINRLSKACFVLRTLENILNRSSLRSAYYAYFQSILTYGIELWGCSGLAASVFKIQKRAIRIMARKPPTFSCRSLFPEWEIPTVADTYIMKVAMFVKRNFSKFECLNSKHSYNTRFGTKLSFKRHNLALSEKSVRYMGVKVWNALPISITQANSMNDFRNKLRIFTQSNCFYSLDEFFEMK
jgi:hypothetical protein